MVQPKVVAQNKIWFNCPTYSSYFDSIDRGWLLELPVMCHHLLGSCLWTLSLDGNMHKLMMQGLYFILPTISSLMHDIVYSPTCSRTSKGLSLGELIHAFCIIIFASYRIIYIVICIIHSLFMHFRWFSGLSYKVPPRYLISGRQKISCFRILLF
jgi:hypothetical protein